MHEVSLMTEAVRLATETARTHGATRVVRLHLCVGALSGVVPEALRFAWDVVRRDTPLADATLDIETVPGSRWCPACAAEFDCADWLTPCPRCRGPGAEARRGREMRIAAVEIE
jgi:hydrogenase nickel incorporation protein HypA/HybF